MKTRVVFGLIIVSVLFSSCVTHKWVYKKNKFYNINNITASDGKQKYVVTTYNVSKGYEADIDIKSDDGYLIVTPVDTSITSCPHCTVTDTSQFHKKGWLATLQSDDNYFPESKHVRDQNKKSKFTYFDSKPELQALTIPIKIRPKLTNTAYKDSFPQQAESGFNVDVAFGWKFNILNIYNGRKGIFGQDINTWSVIPGVFLGLGATDLSMASTRNPVIEIERNAATISSGAFLMLGFNNINIGGAIGFDNTTGPGSKQWVYQGKLWYGLILGIDLLK